MSGGRAASRTEGKLSRTVKLAGVANARHLGGMRTPTGSTVLYDVIRSGSINQEVGADLRRLGVGLVIDFRTETERHTAPEPTFEQLGIRHMWFPLVARDPAPMGVHLEYGYAGFLWMYQNFLEYGRSSIVAVVRSIAESGTGVLFHCAAGEDRTGLVSAVLLSLAGTEPSVVVQDHALSVSLKSAIARGHSVESAARRVAAPQEAMIELLRMMQTRWGGAEGYLLNAGATRSQIDAFRTRAIGAIP